MMKKITITDVARQAQVSKSTVSRVINGATNVDAELKERVLDAIDDLDYQPSRAARTLKKNLNDVVGFLIPSISDTIFGSVLQGAADFAYDNKIGILAYSTADEIERQQKYLDALVAEQVAGLIIVSAPETDPHILHQVEKQGIPIVMLDRKLLGFDADHIASNNLQGAMTAITHLIENGYRRIATIAGSQHVSTGVERLTGYRIALEQANLKLDQDLIKFGNFDAQQSYTAFKDLMALNNPPDAIFVANDEMTLGVLRAIKDMGITVPEQVALIAFDELPMADLLTPSLTTIEQATDALGHEAVRLLIDRIEREERLSRILQIPTKINIRESSQPNS